MFIFPQENLMQNIIKTLSFSACLCHTSIFHLFSKVTRVFNFLESTFISMNCRSVMLAG